MRIVKDERYLLIEENQEKLMNESVLKELNEALVNYTSSIVKKVCELHIYSANRELVDKCNANDIHAVYEPNNKHVVEIVLVLKYVFDDLDYDDDLDRDQFLDATDHERYCEHQHLQKIIDNIINK